MLNPPLKEDQQAVASELLVAIQVEHYGDLLLHITLKYPRIMWLALSAMPPVLYQRATQCLVMYLMGIEKSNADLQDVSFEDALRIYEAEQKGDLHVENFDKFNDWLEYVILYWLSGDQPKTEEMDDMIGSALALCTAGILIGNQSK